MSRDQAKRASAAALDRFLREVEGRAYRMTLVHVRNQEDALDIVQDSMIRLAKRYSNRPPAEWPPLFFRILQNRTRDWGRRQVVRRRVMVVLGREAAEDLSDPVAAMPAPAAEQPDRELERDSAMQALESALRALPQRQAEAFMLRNFEGLDVAQTARAMGCSAGSVKTHYSRAVHRLRVLLGEHWE